MLKKRVAQCKIFQDQIPAFAICYWFHPAHYGIILLVEQHIFFELRMRLQERGLIE